MNRSLPLHVDRNTLWEYTGNNSQFLNFYVPLAKATVERGNLYVAPFDRLDGDLARTLRGLGARSYSDAHPAKAPRAASANGTGPAEVARRGCEPWVARLPGHTMWCQPRRRTNYRQRTLHLAEPKTTVGDLLVVRGDVLHASAPHDSFRLSLSLRMWRALPTADELRRVLAMTRGALAFCDRHKEMLQAALNATQLGESGRTCATFHLDAVS